MHSESLLPLVILRLLGNLELGQVEGSNRHFTLRLYLFTPWKYLPRLGILFYILLRLGSVCLGLAFYFTSYHALAVTAEAWQAMLISYHALAVSADAWHFTLYLITPSSWQYVPRLGILLYILSLLLQSGRTIRVPDCKSPGSKNPRVVDFARLSPSHSQRPAVTGTRRCLPPPAAGRHGSH